MNKVTLIFLSITCFISFATPTRAQPTNKELTQKLLDLVPDIPATRKAFDRGERRYSKAEKHADAILAAAKHHSPRWKKIRKKGEWSAFNENEHLPYLIAAIAYKESAFQPVIRMDTGKKVFAVPHKRAAVYGKKVKHYYQKSDLGFMQIRAPSKAAAKCEIKTRHDMQALLYDINFSYKKSTCVLTNVVEHFVDKYQSPRYHRMHWGGRPPIELKFYKNNPLRKELSIIERYNWGTTPLYKHKRASGYARRIIKIFEKLLEET